MIGEADWHYAVNGLNGTVKAGGYYPVSYTHLDVYKRQLTNG